MRVFLGMVSVLLPLHAVAPTAAPADLQAQMRDAVAILR